MSHSLRLRRAALSCVAVGMALTACGTPAGTDASRTAPAASTGAPTPATPAAGGTDPSHPATTGASPACVAQARALPTERLAASVLMITVNPALGAQADTAPLLERGVAGVFYMSRSGATTATVATTSAALQKAGPTPILISVDQEGGLVQGLRGTGFSQIPSARAQATVAPADLGQQWSTWGRELRAAGVTVDLAPVADVTPSDVATNPPVGDLDRGYGAEPAAASSHVGAVLDGMRAGGVSGTLKHFPGLGRLSVNTDFGEAVDSVTRLDDPILEPFYANLPRAGMVMLSSARYPAIDPERIAAFSPAVVGALRSHGFEGPVISDDLGAAAAVADVAPGERAVRFVDAGGDIVLSVSPEVSEAMVDALRAKADADPAFRSRLADSSARVLAYKESLGLVRCG